MKNFPNILYQGPSIIRINEEDIPYIMFTSDLHIHHKNILYYTRRLNIEGIIDIDTMSNVFAKNINSYVYNIIDNFDKTALSNGKIKLINCVDFIFASASNSYDIYKNFIDKVLPLH